MFAQLDRSFSEFAAAMSLACKHAKDSDQEQQRYFELQSRLSQTALDSWQK